MPWWYQINRVPERFVAETIRPWVDLIQMVIRMYRLQRWMIWFLYIKYHHLISSRWISRGGYRALTGMITTISKYHPVLLIATHSDGLHRECIMFLEKYGYRVRGIDNQKPESTDELVAYYCSGIP